MNKVVKEHIPIERLPEELRRGFTAGEIVEVEVRSLDQTGAAPASGPGVAPEYAATITLEGWLRQLDEQEPQRPALTHGEVERRGALFDQIFGSHAHRNTSIEDAVARIRALRDEDD